MSAIAVALVQAMEHNTDGLLFGEQADQIRLASCGAVFSALTS